MYRPGSVNGIDGVDFGLWVMARGSPFKSLIEIDRSHAFIFNDYKFEFFIVKAKTQQGHVSLFKSPNKGYVGLQDVSL